ncbi:MAG: hypothetical protein WB992_05110 [Bryobacteraceae bacterium]
MAHSATSNLYQERRIEINGWPLRLTSYRIGDKYVCQADNVSPGACLARSSAATLEEAESQALSKAGHLLGKTRRHAIS